MYVRLCIKACEVTGGCYLWQRVCALIEDLVHELVVVRADHLLREVRRVESDGSDAAVQLRDSAARRYVR